MNNFLRDIQNLIFKNGVSAKFMRWNLGKEKLFDISKVLFPDGIIAISSSAKAFITQVESKNYIALVDDCKALIDKYGLKDDDVFIGRDGNYLLFRNGNITEKFLEKNIQCDQINIVSNSINFNGISLTTSEGKLLINGKEIAVVGGDINPSTNKITISGQ